MRRPRIWRELVVVTTIVAGLSLEPHTRDRSGGSMVGVATPAAAAAAKAEEQHFGKEDVTAALRVVGLSFTDAERDSAMEGLAFNLDLYRRLRAVSIENAVVPALVFNPIPAGFRVETAERGIELSPPAHDAAPDDFESLAFWSVRDLAELIRTRRVTSENLTRMYLDRLKRFGGELECVITLTENLALEQARRADAEIAAGHYRGPLHGIPYGVKDLLAVHGYPTTWGAAPYQDQVIDHDATVVRKLDSAGAVLCAKLSMGALAWGDVWYGGKTRNPWDLEQGSSGSSAGPASATAAGLVAFSIGTETWGSIVSPSTRCGDTGLRPTFGRVSRSGAMALSWSMDKIGPICRTVEDCAIVLDAIRGSDGEDPSVVDAAFNYRPEVDWSTIRLGFVASLFEPPKPRRSEDADSTVDNDAEEEAARVRETARDREVLDVLRRGGARLVPIELPDLPIAAMSFVLSAEAAAAFDDLTRSGRDEMLVRQIKNAWPNEFRTARLIPAVEYIQANRLRTRVISEMSALMGRVDVYVAPSFGGDNLLLTNLTGHPCVVLPNGFTPDGHPRSITFVGGLFDEATLLAVARAYQEATDHHLRHPDRYVH